MVELADKSPSAKNSLEYYRHIDLPVSEWDKIRILNENVDRKILLKVYDNNYSVFDIFREYLLIQNPRNTSEVNVAYKNPGEGKGRIVLLGTLEKLTKFLSVAKMKLLSQTNILGPSILMI